VDAMACFFSNDRCQNRHGLNVKTTRVLLPSFQKSGPRHERSGSTEIVIHSFIAMTLDHVRYAQLSSGVLLHHVTRTVLFYSNVPTLPLFLRELSLSWKLASDPAFIAVPFVLSQS
jgi:hypothetical protein